MFQFSSKKIVVQQGTLVNKGAELVRAVNSEEEILDTTLKTFIEVIDLGEVIEMLIELMRMKGISSIWSGLLEQLELVKSCCLQV